MILVRELLNDCDPRNPPYTFKVVGRQNPGVHSTRWFYLLNGYFFGGVFLRFFTWLLDQMYTFSEDSSLKLFLCLFAVMGADAYVGWYFLSPQTHNIASKYRSGLFLVHVLMSWLAMKVVGPLQTTRGMIFVLSLMGVYNATVDFETMLQEENSPTRVYWWKHDNKYAFHASYRMTTPFKHLGFAVGAVLQIFLPIKLICLWEILYIIYFFEDIMRD